MWNVTIRDLTTNQDISLDLPMADIESVLKQNHEYIVVDYDGSILRCGEYANINDINDFLLYCQENDIDETTLSILTKVCYGYSEVREKIESENYTIVDFTSITSAWNGDITDADDKGLCLFEAEQLSLPFTYEPAMEDYIRWDAFWRDANCSGWQAVTVSDNDYLVRV